MPTFRLETVIAASVVDCFELSLSVDAHTASMGSSGEQAIAGVTTGALQLHDTVTWRARHFGAEFQLTSAITAYQRPTRFVDEQRHGPFRRWCHEHRFSETGSGSTLMVDVVRFRSPLGPLGTVADAVVLRRYLRQLLTKRNAWLKRTLESR
jgi:ligand-binding SRPBCC domain-containing protein